MITVEFWPDHIRICGHAGYAETGKDIVCAAVSILYQTFEASLEALDPGCIPEETVDETVNEHEISWQQPLNTAGETLLTALRIGLRGVAEEYPNNVTIYEYK